jgi:hypothetical protein
MVDLLITAGDLSILDQDFKFGFSDEQHQEHLLIAQKGSVKQFPETGVGIENYLLADDVNAMLREIRHQFQADGMQVLSVTYDENTHALTYDAGYSS